MPTGGLVPYDDQSATGTAPPPQIGDSLPRTFYKSSLLVTKLPSSETY
jgi:hypothetical protein